jgi:hypothetical protein
LGQKKSVKKIGSNTTKIEKGYRLVYELIYLVEEQILVNFFPTGGTLALPIKNSKTFSHPDMTIHTSMDSPCRV